ncbi:hypothetical protein KJ966_18860 [bacterium]|nr:hypothetical protein [bacterium]
MIKKLLEFILYKKNKPLCGDNSTELLETTMESYFLSFLTRNDAAGVSGPEALYSSNDGDLIDRQGIIPQC